MRIKLSMYGDRRVWAEMRKKQTEFLEAMLSWLPAQGDELLAIAQRDAPKASGKLARTGVVSVQTLKNRVRVAVAFTDDKAAAVHEGIHWRVKVDGTRGYKWFEKGFVKWAPQFVPGAADILRRIAGG